MTLKLFFCQPFHDNAWIHNHLYITCNNGKEDFIHEFTYNSESFETSSGLRILLFCIKILT